MKAYTTNPEVAPGSFFDYTTRPAGGRAHRGASAETRVVSPLPKLAAAPAAFDIRDVNGVYAPATPTSLSTISCAVPI